VDAIFTLYSDRDYLEIKDYELRITNKIVILTKEGSSKQKNNWIANWLDSSLRSEWQVIKIPIVTALPRWLNSLFRRADSTKPILISSIIDYRNLMPLFPELMKILSWKLKKRITDYGLRITNKDNKTSSFKKKSAICNPQSNNSIILISSYAVAKNIDMPVWWTSEIYFHQPMHYIWTLYDEYVWSMERWRKRLYKLIVPRLRRRDQQYRQYNTIYANSESTMTQIKKIYGLWDQSIQVVHPPIAQQFFTESIVTLPDNYFFYINRLTKLFKHLDKIILLCNRHHVPLIIAGDGPDKEYLMSIAGPTITFVGWVSNIQDKITLMKRSRWILNIAHESFGIVTAEALLLGVPVFGYQWGATPELVDEISGVLTPSVDEKTMDDYFTQFLDRSFDREMIQKHAKITLWVQQEFRT
jgi:glycosyltransferase involved in cell wall biosynthesis